MTSKLATLKIDPEVEVTNKKAQDLFDSLYCEPAKWPEPVHMRHQIGKGWPVNGVFEDNGTYHGLVHNPVLGQWFHVWWALDGRCLTLGCEDDCWRLVIR